MSYSQGGYMMPDKYASFSELASYEVYNQDYKIQFEIRPSNIIMLAIHGGGIETGTSELAVGLAGNEYSYYIFEGLKKSGNADLHITSTHFDEPHALTIISKEDYAVSFHGYNDKSEKHTKIGGADKALRSKIHEALVSKGFSTEILSDQDPVSGTSPRNITNKTARRMGVQIEISKAQREAFFQLTREMNVKILKPRNFLSIYQLLEVHFLLDKSDTFSIY